VLPATIVGSRLSYIDESAVNVALPAIQRNFDTSFATMQWVFNGYMLTLASLILLGGSASDRFGCRRIFLIGLVGFAVASLASGLAPSENWLIVARLAQGAAAALLMPASLAIIGAVYSERRAVSRSAFGRRLAWLSSPLPGLGGGLGDVIKWRAIFFANLPIAALALLLAVKLAPDGGTGRSEPLDWPGALFAVLALGLLSYGLIAVGEGERTLGLAALAAATPAMGLFIWTEARSAALIVPLSLFRDMQFAGVNGLTAIYYAALSGVLFLLPFMLIEVHGYSAIAAGAAFMPLSAIMAIGSRWSGGLGDRFGSRMPLVLGCSITAIGYCLFGFSASDPDYWTGLLPGLILVGTGLTLVVAPLTAAVFESVPTSRSGSASGSTMPSTWRAG
jgi:EmrB/QacA subfamily drug resistance transporter